MRYFGPAQYRNDLKTFISQKLQERRGIVFLEIL